MLIDRFFSVAQLDGILFSKKDALGRSLYFPSGLLGPAYVVATEEQKQRIIRGYILTADIFIAAVIGMAFAFAILEVPFVLSLLAVPLALIAFPLSARRRVRGLEKTPERLTRREANHTMARFTSWRMLFFIEVLVVFLFVGRILTLIQSWSWEQFSIAVALGLAALVSGYQIFLKRGSDQN